MMVPIIPVKLRNRAKTKARKNATTAVISQPPMTENTPVTLNTALSLDHALSANEAPIDTMNTT